MVNYKLYIRPNLLVTKKNLRNATEGIASNTIIVLDIIEFKPIIKNGIINDKRSSCSNKNRMKNQD